MKPTSVGNAWSKLQKLCCPRTARTRTADTRCVARRARPACGVTCGVRSRAQAGQRVFGLVGCCERPKCGRDAVNTRAQAARGLRKAVVRRHAPGTARPSARAALSGPLLLSCTSCSKLCRTAPGGSATPRLRHAPLAAPHSRRSLPPCRRLESWRAHDSERTPISSTWVLVLITPPQSSAQQRRQRVFDEIQVQRVAHQQPHARQDQQQQS